MPGTDIRARVKSILAREWRVPIESIADSAALNEIPQWDSLGHITILLALQAEFGFELTPETVQEMVSLDRIVAQLDSPALVH